MKGLPAFSDWRVVLGSHMGARVVAAVCLVAGVAVLLSAWSLVWERRRARAAGLLALRAAGVGVCLLVALQPSLELGQVTRVPNHVAVLVDASRSMTVRPTDGGKARYERAAALVEQAAPLWERWQGEGHRVEVFTFGEVLAPTAAGELRSPPQADATRIGEALTELRGRYAGQELGGVILLSDGIDTGRIGRGPLDGETARVIGALHVPVSTVLMAEPEIRDLSVTGVLADDFAFVRTPIRLEAVVRASGLANRQIEVTLSRDGHMVDARGVVLKTNDAEERVSFDWTPAEPGNFVFEIATPLLRGEALASNNSQVFALKVIRDRVRVLHVCGRPSWQERFLRSMLRLDPNVDLVSFFILRTETDEQPWNPRDEMALIPFPYREIFEEQLKSFDLLIFDNFNYGPYRVEPYLAGVRDYIQSGGALAMVGGDLSFASGGYHASALADVLPVDLDGVPDTGDRSFTKEAFRPKLTPAGRAHPVTSLSLDAHVNDTRWANLPPLEGMNRIKRLRPGASALLVHPAQKTGDGGPAPVLAVTEAGKGRTLALLTDSAWNWGFAAAGTGDEGRMFQHFWENAIRWLVRDPNLTLLRVDFDKAEFRRGQLIDARVRSRHADFTPAGNVDVALQLFSASSAGQEKPLRDLRTTTSGDGEAHVEMAELPPGAYRLSGRGTIDGRATGAEQTFVVRAEGRELEDVAPRDGVLKEIAAQSGGKFTRESLGSPEVRKPREVRLGSLRTVQVWSHPLLLLLALGLLGTEWTLRRRAGHR